ncbi:MAG: DUF4407 domain-containing protein [Deltaproteobacteria bacterium]|nr:DUF4407 domain-containing protein [Deltaproteobacteria bacterium]
MTEPTAPPPAPTPAAATPPAPPASAPTAAAAAVIEPPAPSLPAAAPPTASEDRYRYGSVQDVSLFTRFLWFCAGADAQLLVRCPNSDRVKFQGLGGVVLTVGVLAFFSGSYAFYTVFSPKDATALGERVLHLPSAAASVFFGMVWSLIIFNIDRFIISSTGKGDGTDKITWGEFVNSLPRLAMAIIIGLCLSKPLEIKILESEIESALEKEQKEFLAELNDVSEGLVGKERAALRDKIDGLQKRTDDNDGALEKRRLEIQQQRRELELEAEGKTGSGAAGRGPAWRDKRDNLDRMEAELNRDREAIGKKNTMVGDELAEAKTALAALDSKLATEKASNLQVARHLDGLMKRIQVSHDIGGMIPIAIMLLLLCIEAGPIFFKLMVIKGAYDYLDENQKRVVRAKAGIEPDARILSDGKGKSIHIDLHHGVTAVLDEEKRRLDTERAMAAAVHEAWKKKTGAAIEQNPNAFVKR